MASLYYIKKEHKSSSFVFDHKDENNKKEKCKYCVCVCIYTYKHIILYMKVGQGS